MTGRPRLRARAGMLAVPCLARARARHPPRVGILRPSLPLDTGGRSPLERGLATPRQDVATAFRAGVAVPQVLLARADRVIQ